MTSPYPASVDSSFADFLRRPLTVSLATRDAACVPTVVRALGFRYVVATRLLSVYVAARQAGGTAANVRDNGWAAVAFSEPSSHLSMQVKSNEARIDAAGPGDLAHLAVYREQIVSEIVALNYPEPSVRALFAAGDEPMLAVRLTPSQFFTQTPGPGAGRRLVDTTP